MDDVTFTWKSAEYLGFSPFFTSQCGCRVRFASVPSPYLSGPKLCLPLLAWTQVRAYLG